MIKLLVIFAALFAVAFAAVRVCELVHFVSGTTHVLCMPVHLPAHFFCAILFCTVP